MELDSVHTPRRSARKRKRSGSFNPATYVNAAKENLSQEEENHSPFPVKRRKKKSTPNRGKGKKAAVKKTSRKTARASPVSKRTLTADQEIEALSQNSEILVVVLDPNAAIKPAILEWQKQFRSNASKATVSILNFFVGACGCSEAITEDMLDMNPKVVLKDMQPNLPENEASYPLVSRAGTFRKFPARLTQAIDLFVDCIEPFTFVEGQDDFSVLEIVIDWLIALSRCNMRSLRHTGSFLSFKLQSSILRIAHSDSKLQSVRTQQLKVEKKRKKGNAGKISQLQSDISDLKTRIKFAATHVDNLFQSVFVSRYRDVWPVLRSLALQSLCDCILTSPSFVSDQVLKFVGWSLNNPDAGNRLIALNGITSFVNNDSVRSSLSAFLERFLPRIIEMHNDVDHNVAAAAVDACSAILVHDDILAEQEAFGEVALLLWDANSRVRQAAALHVFEDSFVVEDGKDDVQRRLEDLEQLYTLFEECCPNIADLDPKIAVAYLVDSFFFRLDCLRNFSSICSSLLEGEEGNAASAERSAEQAKQRQAFLARCLLGCAQIIYHQAPINSIHPKKPNKEKQAMLSAAEEDICEFVASRNFRNLVDVFQTDEEVLSCLCRVLSLSPSPATTPTALLKTLSSCLNKSTSSSSLSAIAAAMKRLGGHQQLHDHAVRLKASFEDLSEEPSSDEVSLSLSACSARLRALSSQIDVSELVESEDLDHALSTHCLLDFDASEDVSEAQQLIICDLLRITMQDLLWLARRLRSADANSEDESSLRTLLSSRTSTLSSSLSVLLHPNSPARLVCEASELLSVLSVFVSGNPELRHCLPLELYQRYVARFRSALEGDFNAIAKSLFASAQTIAGAHCPERIAVAGLVLSQHGVHEAETDGATNSLSAFFRKHDMLKALALAQLYALTFTFEIVKKNDESGRVKELARHLMLSQGLNRPHCFDVLLCGGVDYALSGDAENIAFLMALSPFVSRCSANQASRVVRHAKAALDALQNAVEENDAEVPDLDEFVELCEKRMRFESRKQQKQLEMLAEDEEENDDEEEEEDREQAEKMEVDSIASPAAQPHSQDSEESNEEQQQEQQEEEEEEDE